MTEELLNKINNSFQKICSQRLLLGNTNVLFSDDEYSEMVDALENMCKVLIGGKFDRRSLNYGQIFITLVEIAKRWKNSNSIDENDNDTGYWSFVCKTLLVKDEYYQKIRNAFTQIISELAKDVGKNQNNIPIVRVGQKYYATIMMHAFAPTSSLYSFFDLCFNVFKKDLDYSFTKEDGWIGEIITEKLRLVLRHGYKDDKGISIGSSIYKINIGLRSYVLHPNLKEDFERFVNDTLYKINKLYYLEGVDECSWVDVNLVTWWKSVRGMTEKHIVAKGNRMSAVTSDKIVVKYVRKDDKVFLCVPPIRLIEETEEVNIVVSVGNQVVISQKIDTKRGDLVISTKQVDLELNQLLADASSIDVRVCIYNNNNEEIFNSESQKSTSLKRDFILFSEEKELFNQVMPPSNYFVYALDIDGMRKPDECASFGSHIYNIYPKVGEVLAGVNRKVSFVENEKSSCIGKKVCLLGNVPYAEWKKDNVSCQVYANQVQLALPVDINYKALELIISGKQFKITDFEMVPNEESYCGYDITSCIPKSIGVIVSLYSYEKKEVLFEETIVLFDNFRMNLNSPYYYGEMERKLTIEYDGTINVVSWGQQDDSVSYQLEDGELLVWPPNLRWRINSGQWHSSPLIGLQWYKKLLENGDLLEIDYPYYGHSFQVFAKSRKKRMEITLDSINKKFKIGRCIYENDNIEEIMVCLSDRMNMELALFRVSTKEFFMDSPFVYRDGIVFWNVVETFIGDENGKFVVEVGDNVKELDYHNQIIFDGLKEDVYDTIVRIKSKNIFAKENPVIYKGSLPVGKEELFKYRNKLLKIYSVSSSFSFDTNKWEMLNYDYVIKNLSYIEVQEDDGVHGYYLGKLLINKGGRWQDIDDLRLTNERGEVDLINPVRIEFRSNNSLWLIAGYNVEDKYDFLGELIFDYAKGQLCNYNAKYNPYNRYKIVNLYKFKEEQDNV